MPVQTRSAALTHRSRMKRAEDTVFAPKPELAARMIGRFLDAGHRVDWVARDEVSGGQLVPAAG